MTPLISRDAAIAAVPSFCTGTCLHDRCHPLRVAVADIRALPEIVLDIESALEVATREWGVHYNDGNRKGLRAIIEASLGITK